MPIPNEYSYVEKPFLDQLTGLGRTVHDLNKEQKDDPSFSYRTNFKELILEPIFKESISKINPWLTEMQIEHILRDLKFTKHSTTLDANERFHNVLLGAGEDKLMMDNQHSGSKNQPVFLIDFDNPEINNFIAINQFKVRELGKTTHVVPDIVLFINGLPIGVVECKSPTAGGDQSAIEEAINQLNRYSHNRASDISEGNEKLFVYNQLMIVTSRQEARVGSLYAPRQFYLERKDPYPITLDELGKNHTSQHILVAGMLNKVNLLQIIQNFVLFQQDESGKKYKIVCRYQQFRAVSKMLMNLEDPTKTKEEKGGIIWHTQGSGKSLTMVFLIRALRNKEFGKGYKVVFVTDRKDLQRQIGKTALAIGEYIYPKDASSNTIDTVQALLRDESSQIINAMVHKFRNKDEEVVELPILNTSDKILLLIDEGHRSHASLLGANIMNALPNAVRVAFTGTPIITGKNRKKSHDIFGSYIDTYTIEQAVNDGATVQIYYEGRTSDDGISDKDAMDKAFVDMFHDKTKEEQEEIMKRYGSTRLYLEAPEIIKEKAKDMIRHYLESGVFINGFKAQVVAHSKIAVVEYKKALDKAIFEELLALKNGTSTLSNADKISLEVLEMLEVGAIISGEHNQETFYNEYTNETTHKRQIENFKKPFVHKDLNKQSGLGIIVVTAMLLTGFDAPIEQVMYLDKKLVEHNLLQAIARVNRTYKGKTCGYIVDYFGVGNHLKEALEIFSQDDIQGALMDVRDELVKLKQHHQRIMHFWNRNEIHDRTTDTDIDECVELLKDEELRAEYTVAYKMMTKSMDIVLPHAGALRYADDYKIFGFILITARNRYRDNTLDITDAGPKMKQIINEYMISKGIDMTVPPVSLMDTEFDMFLDGLHSNKSKASEMEHAIRHHISEYYDKDPEFYKSLSERLEELLKNKEEKWDLIVAELKQLLAQTKEGRTEDVDQTGLDIKVEIPFYDIIKTECDSLETEQDSLIQMTIDLVEEIQHHVYKVGFWTRPLAMKDMQRSLLNIMKQKYKLPVDIARQILERITKLAKDLGDILLLG